MLTDDSSLHLLCSLLLLLLMLLVLSVSLPLPLPFPFPLPLSFPFSLPLPLSLPFPSLRPSRSMVLWLWRNIVVVVAPVIMVTVVTMVAVAMLLWRLVVSAVVLSPPGWGWGLVQRVGGPTALPLLDLLEVTLESGLSWDLHDGTVHKHPTHIIIIQTD